jgi:sugar lactone lactonase YvrE
MKLCLLLATAMAVSPFLCCAQGIISTIAGGGSQSPVDGAPATGALLFQPTGIAVDGGGNVYFVESGAYRVRKVSASGTISTFAGTGTAGIAAAGSIGDGGPATSASFFFSGLREGIVVDSAGNVYITDSGNNRVRKIDTRGIITTFAGALLAGSPGDGGPATSARLSRPSALALDNAGNLYIAELTGARVRKVDSAGIISTVAGNGSFGFSGDGGPATSASFNAPTGLAVDSAGNLYIGDNTSQRVRKVDTSGIINTIIGRGTIGFSGDGGPATSAAFQGIQGLAVDSGGNLFIVDNGNKRIRKVDPAGMITTVAGTGGFGNDGDGGAATSATFSGPIDVAVDASGTLYISDSPGGRIRKVAVAPPAAGPAIISTVAGSNNLSLGDGGPATSALLGNAQGVAVDGAGNIYIAEPFFGRVRKVDISGVIRTVAGNGTFGFSGDGGPASNAQLVSVSTTHVGVAVDALGNLYLADGDNHRIRKVNTAGIISTVAGNGIRAFSGDGGPANAASLTFPRGVAVDNAGNLYVADTGNHRIRKVNTSGIISTVAGSALNRFAGDGGPATSASLNGPLSVAVDSAGNLYIADTVNLRIRKVTMAGIISTVAGNGTRGFSGDGGPAPVAQFSQIDGVAVDSNSNLYITDRDNRRIRKVDVAGIITTFAGNGSTGLAGDGSAAISAQLSGPGDVAVDASGNVYIADGTRVRKATIAAGGPTITPNGVVNGASFQSGVVPNSLSNTPSRTKT